MNRLNFNHLYYFYIVSMLGSIKAAAEKLHVSQPTISDQIKLLEEYFDCKLFERKNRSLVLTKNGKLALSYAQDFFDMANELTSRLRKNENIEKLSVDIGITHYMSQYFLFETLTPLFEQNDLMIKVQENQRHLLLADLEEGQLDLVFTDHNDSLTSHMEAYRIGVNKTFIVAHKKFKKYKKEFPQSLNDIAFFNYTNESLLKYEIGLFFSKHNLAPRVIGEADDIDLFQMVTEQGLAFTIVPEVAKNRFCQNADVIVLGELKELQTSVFAIMKKSYQGPAKKLIKGLSYDK